MISHDCASPMMPQSEVYWSYVSETAVENLGVFAEAAAILN